MTTTNNWIAYFKKNALQNRINWDQEPGISPAETHTILRSLQAWQLGESSDGRHLIHAAAKYAEKTADPEYLEAIKLFIKEEQKHGNNLGLYLDKIGQPRVKKDWGDTLFRQVRYFNTNMELWTLAVIVVESTAQIFYEALGHATSCPLLKEICTDILTDEVEHIVFQKERLSIIYDSKSPFSKAWRKPAYKLFFFFVSQLVWFAHRQLFKAGGFSYQTYSEEMIGKYNQTIIAVVEAARTPVRNKNIFGYEY